MPPESPDTSGQARLQGHQTLTGNRLRPGMPRIERGTPSGRRLHPHTSRAIMPPGALHRFRRDRLTLLPPTSRGLIVSERNAHDPLAEATVAQITEGMVVGLGTGLTAARGIRALARRVAEENLDVRCVPTSEAAETLAKELGLQLADFAMLEEVDFLFDGADEVDDELRVLKGSGGAMTRERMVAWAARQSVYMIDESKLVDKLGQNSTLAIAVMAFGLASIRGCLRELGLNGVCRRTINGDLFVTDNGNLILDVSLADHDLEELAAALNDIPGVVDHGLFLNEADELLVERADGEIERRVRPNSTANA